MKKRLMFCFSRLLLLSVFFSVGVGFSVRAEQPQAEQSEASKPAELSSEQTSPVQVTSQLSPDPSTIGDVLRFDVTVVYKPGITVNLPVGLNFEPLHLIDISETPAEATGSEFRKVFTLRLQHFNVGEAQVPAFPITYVSEGGQVETVQVPPHGFTVETLLANEADPQRQTEDPPISLEYPNRWAEIAIYSFLAALALGIGGTLLWNRWRRRERVIPAPPPIPAHEQALASLQQLEAKDLLRQEQYADYYLELTEITKAYLEGRFAIPTLDQTTDEIRRSLTSLAAKIAPLKPSEVVRFLQNCDLIKFARFTPSLEEGKAALEEVRSMVETTMPKAEGSENSANSSLKTDEKAA